MHRIWASHIFSILKDIIKIIFYIFIMSWAISILIIGIHDIDFIGFISSLFVSVGITCILCKITNCKYNKSTLHTKLLSIINFFSYFSLSMSAVSIALDVLISSTSIVSETISVINIGFVPESFCLIIYLLFDTLHGGFLETCIQLDMIHDGYGSDYSKIYLIFNMIIYILILVFGMLCIISIMVIPWFYINQIVPTGPTHYVIVVYQILS